MEGTVALMNVIHIVTRGARSRPCVVATAKGNSTRFSTRTFHVIDLRPAGTVRGKVNTPVGMVPCGFGINRPMVGQPRQIAAGKVHSVDLGVAVARSEEHTSELQSRENLVCRLLLEEKKIRAHTG